MKLLVAIVMLMSSLVTAQTATPSPAKITYLRCGTLYDGKSDAPQRNVTVRVAGEKIEAVSAGSPEAGAEVIDLSRRGLLAGPDRYPHSRALAGRYHRRRLRRPVAEVVDAVSHHPWDTVSARRALEYGFTTIRDLETEGAGYADVDIKKAINAGVIPGPRMQVAGRAMDVTGAYPLLGYSWELKMPKGVQEVDGADGRSQGGARTDLTTAWTGSRCTATAAISCGPTACSTTFRLSLSTN